MVISARGNKILGIVLRVLLGVLFLLSAVAKLVGIDLFELYLYSFGLLPLSVCFVAARICIGVELVVGLFLLLGWFRRLVLAVTFLLLILFSLFLCYALMIGRSDSCQCFGQWMNISPALSLLKNALLIVLVLLAGRCLRASAQELRHSDSQMFNHSDNQTFRRYFRTPLAALLLVGAMVLPFAVSVPDNWAFGRSVEPFNREVLAAAIAPDGTMGEQSLSEGHRLVAFVTPGCPYCKMAHQKLDAIVSRHHIAADRIVYVQPSDLPGDLFLQITYGARPLILLLDNGEVISTYHYRNIDEREVADFLSHN